MASENADPEQRWASIRRKIDQHADVLRQQGGIVSRKSRGRRVWSIRFRAADKAGRAVHKAIYLGGEGDDELLRRAGEYLIELRRPKTVSGQIALYARMVEAMDRMLLRRLEAERRQRAG